MTTDNWMTLAFYVFAVGMVISAFAVVTLPRILHSALAMVGFFIITSGVYVLLRAEFVAAVQITIYVGAITVLFLFAIMLTNRSYAPDSNPPNAQWILAGIVALGFLGVLLLAISSGVFPQGGQITGDATILIGRLMLSNYVLAFEIAAVLLLVAMVGAIIISRETDPTEKQPRLDTSDLRISDPGNPRKR